MEDQKQGMKQTHGGDDEGGGAAPAIVKKPQLAKFASMPDMNIRDLFWRIMAAYAAKESIDIAKYTESRNTLTKIAITVLENPQGSYHELSQNLTALYSAQMILDGDWQDMFEMLIDTTQNSNAQKPIAKALKKLYEQEKYANKIAAYLENMIKNMTMLSAALVYISSIDDQKLVERLKKWLTIIAQTDIENNQIYAISALAMIKDDKEVKRTLLGLLGHWDAHTRKAIATLFRKSIDEEVIAAAKKQIAIEADAEVKKQLEKLIK